MIDRRQMLIGLGVSAMAGALSSRPVLADETILTLRGRFPKAGPDGSVSSSLSDLDALGRTSFSTATPWHDGVNEFSGVSVKNYLGAFGAAPKTIRLVALNDYSVETDVAELIEADALLATRRNGQAMPISDKGPVFLLFPFDDRQELKHQSYYSRAVWQLTEIDIVA